MELRKPGLSNLESVQERSKDMNTALIALLSLVASVSGSEQKKATERLMVLIDYLEISLIHLLVSIFVQMLFLI